MPIDSPPPLPASTRSYYSSGAWDVDRVDRAIRYLDQGCFSEACALRDAVRKDLRARGAEDQLRGLFCSLDIEIEGGESGHGNAPMEAMRRLASGFFGENGSAASPSTVGAIVEDVAGMGLAVCYFHLEPREGRWWPRLTWWPLDAVEVDGTKVDGRSYVALTEGGQRIPIEGDNWIVFRAAEGVAHRRGAIRGMGSQWIAAAYTRGDWATLSSTTGPRRIGMLPPGVKATSPEGRRIATDVAGLSLGRSGMIHEFVEGGKAAVYQLDGRSDQHAIHEDLLKWIASDYAIGLLGTDGISALGTTGTYGARQTLYGVAWDVVLGGARVLTAGFTEISNRWARYNAGRDRGPRAEVKVPDLEEQLAITEEAKRRPAMVTELSTLAARGPLSVEVVREVADRYGTRVSDEYCAIWAGSMNSPSSEENIS